MNLIGRIQRLEGHKTDRDKTRELHDLLGVENGTPDLTVPVQAFMKAVPGVGVETVLAYVRALAEFGQEVTV